MKVAVVGAGFAGLALCYYLLEKGHQVELFDAKEVGAGASGVSSGLMHPYVGERANRSLYATEALEESKKLLAIAQEFVDLPVADYSGILRKSTKEQSEKLRQYDDVEEVEEGVFLIKSGVAVHSKRYLSGLFAALQKRGIVFTKKEVKSFDLPHDLSFFALGAGVFSFEEAEKLGLRPVKGQALICPWPKEMPPLQKSIVGKGHIIPLNENQIHLGSTYERGSLDEEFTPGKILPDLAEKARNLVPGLEIQKYLGGGAGVRVAKSGHYYPLLTKIKAKAWLMSGLGSRGLLYHAYAAKELVYTAFNPSIKPL